MVLRFNLTISCYKLIFNLFKLPLVLIDRTAPRDAMNSILKPALFIVSLSLLSGCFEGRQNTAKLCEKNPSLECENLNMGDGQCRVTRTDLIWHRYNNLKTPSNMAKIEEHELLAKYQTCLDLAAQIQPITALEVKEARIIALNYAHKTQGRLIEELKNVDDPHVYYFLWTKGDDNAKRRFLQLESTGRLDTPTLQYYLATYYSNRDPIRTIKLLNRGLELSKQDDLDTRLIKALANIHQKQQQDELAYMWAIIGKEFDLPVANDKQLAVFYPFSDEKRQAIHEHAEKLTKSLKKGQFRASALPSQDALSKL